MNRVASLLAAAGVLASPLAAQAQATNGPVQVTLNHLYAYHSNGTRDPSGDAFCQKHYAAFLNTSIAAAFNTPMNKSWAVAGFYLHPLGIQGRYAYGNFYRKTFTSGQLYGVTFSVSAKDMSDPVARVSFIPSASMTCLLTNEVAAPGSVEVEKKH